MLFKKASGANNTISNEACERLLHWYKGVTSMEETKTESAMRISMLSKEEALTRGRAEGILDNVAELNVFRVLLKHPRVAKELNSTIMSLLDGHQALDARLRELIIMRLGWLTKSNYEWTQHWRIALLFGLSEAELEAVKDWSDASCFSKLDQLVLKATDEVFNDGAVGKKTWQGLQEALETEEELIEVVVCIGNWHMFSQLLRSLDIPLEDGVADWPPRGEAP